MSTPQRVDKDGYTGHRVCINRRYCLICLGSAIPSCGESPAKEALDGNFGAVDPTSCKSRNGALHRCKIFRLGSPIRHPSCMGRLLIRMAWKDIRVRANKS